MSCSPFRQTISKHARRFKETHILITIPGIKYIQAAKIISQVVDPNRFRNKYKFFAYCALVKHPRISGGRKYGTTRIHGNKTLKCVFQMAAHSAIRGNNAFNVLYYHLRQKGLTDKNARNAVARKIASLSLCLWRNHQCFRNELLLENLPVEE